MSRAPSALESLALRSATDERGMPMGALVEQLVRMGYELTAVEAAVIGLMKSGALSVVAFDAVRRSSAPRGTYEPRLRARRVSPSTPR